MSNGIAPGLKTLAVPCADLWTLEGNPRVGDVPAVKRSLERFGQRAPIVYREEHHPDTGEARKVVYAGNHRLMAARELGWDMIAAVDAADLSHEEVKAFALADNRTGDLGGYDDEALATLLEDVRQADPSLLGDTGYDDDALAELLDDWSVEDGPDLDEVPDVVGDEPPVSKLGDVWLLGRHTLVCGDSTDADTYGHFSGPADAMWTDPPYGVSYVGKTADALTIENDDLDEGQLEEFLVAAFTAALGALKPGANVFSAAPPGPLMSVFAAVLVKLGVYRQQLIWVKDAMVLGRSDYHYKHEPIFYGWKPGAAHTEPADRKQVSVLEFDRPKANREHPTMKPVELVAYCLNNSAPGVVLEPFGGSGTTLIAAEETGRTCHTIELDPHYVDVICRRYERHTAITPILQATGEPYSFLEDD